MALTVGSRLTCWRWGVAHDHGEYVPLLLCVAVPFGLELLRGPPRLHGLGGKTLFLSNVVNSHEGRRVADVFHGLLVLLDKQFQDAHVASIFEISLAW